MDRKEFNIIKKMADEELMLVHKAQNWMSCAIIRDGMEKEVAIFTRADNFEQAVKRMERIIKKAKV